MKSTIHTRYRWIPAKQTQLSDNQLDLIVVVAGGWVVLAVMTLACLVWS